MSVDRVLFQHLLVLLGHAWRCSELTPASVGLLVGSGGARADSTQCLQLFLVVRTFHSSQGEALGGARGKRHVPAVLLHPVPCVLALMLAPTAVGLLGRTRGSAQRPHPSIHWTDTAWNHRPQEWSGRGRGGMSGQPSHHARPRL